MMAKDPGNARGIEGGKIVGLCEELQRKCHA